MTRADTAVSHRKPQAHGISDHRKGAPAGSGAQHKGRPLSAGDRLEVPPAVFLAAPARLRGEAKDCSAIGPARAGIAPRPSTLTRARGSRNWRPVFHGPRRQSTRRLAIPSGTRQGLLGPRPGNAKALRSSARHSLGAEERDALCHPMRGPRVPPWDGACGGRPDRSRSKVRSTLQQTCRCPLEPWASIACCFLKGFHVRIPRRLRQDNHDGQESVKSPDAAVGASIDERTVTRRPQGT
jgi:hypothetical protein